MRVCACVYECVCLHVYMYIRVQILSCENMYALCMGCTPIISDSICLHVYLSTHALSPLTCTCILNIIISRRHATAKIMKIEQHAKVKNKLALSVSVVHLWLLGLSFKSDNRGI